MYFLKTLRSSSKTNQDLDDDYHEDNSDSKDDLSQPSSSTHDAIRNSAKIQNRQYRNNMKIIMEKGIKKKQHKVGDIVNLKLPKANRSKLGHTHLPCKIIKIKSGCCWLGCSEGKLKHSYKAENLEKTKIKSMKELDNIPDKVITLSEAVKSQNVSCKCPNTLCSSFKCPCKKANMSCNSKCHPGKNCYN